MKDSYYFSHDASAHDDPKLIELNDKYGFAGIGCYWTLIEFLRSQDDYSISLKFLPAFAKRFGADEKMVKAVVKDFDLFQINGNETFFSESLCRRMELANEKRQRKVEAGKRSGKARSQKPAGKPEKNDKNDFPAFVSSIFKYFSKDVVNNLSNEEKKEWIETLEKLIELEYDEQSIETAVKNAMQNDFWRKNFLLLTDLLKETENGAMHIDLFLELES